MAFARDKPLSFQNTHFTSISSQGNYRTDSPLQHDPQKRPNTAPEFFGQKLATFPDLKFGVEKNLFDGNEIDDETRFIDRTVSPIFTGLNSKFRNRINSLSSQDSGIFSDSTSILSPESSQFDSQARIPCFSPNKSIIFSAARDLRLEPQHTRQTSAPENFTTPPTYFPVPPRRSKLVSPTICNQTHPYRLPPSKSPGALSRNNFFLSPRAQSFKRPVTPLPRISGKFDNSVSSQIELNNFDSEDPLSLPSIFTNSPGTFQSNSTPIKYKLDISSQNESPFQEKQFLPLSQASSYYSLEDLPAITDTNTSPLASISTPHLAFSDAVTTRIPSNFSLLSRSGLSVTSGSRTSSEESLLYHTPDKCEEKKNLETLTPDKIGKIAIPSKFFCHETIRSQQSEFPPIVPAKLSNQPTYIGKYEIIDQIGSGTYGHVQKAWDFVTKRFVAIKTFVNREPYKGIPQHTYREIRAFQYKSHQGLLESIEVIQTEDGPCGFPMLHLVTEFIDQDLKIFIEQQPHLLVEEKIKSIMVQLVSAVSHLNWVLQIMHRDLKPANILISDDGLIKIADFGMAKHYKYMKLLTPHVVTLWYRAPEILMNCAYDYAVDVWSMGCIFAELYNKLPFFEGNSEIAQLNLIISRIGLPPRDKWSPDSPIPYDQFVNNTCLSLNQLLPTAPYYALKAIESMLEFDPETRVRSDQLDELEYFK